MSRVFTPSALGSEIVRRQRAYTKDDFAKTKLIFRILFTVPFLAIVLVFYVWVRYQIVTYGYDINTLQEKQSRLVEEGKKLKVELATLKSPQRIEQVAKEKLKMQTPTASQIRELP